MSSTETPIARKNTQKTIRVVRLVRKTSIPKLIASGAVGLLAGCVLGVWISQMTSDLRYKDAEKRMEQEHTARLEAEDKMFRMHLAFEDMEEKMKSGNWASMSAGQTASVDLLRVNSSNSISSNPVGSGNGVDDLKKTSGLISQEAKEWKSRYRYAAIKFNRLTANYAQLHKKYLSLTGAGGATKGVITGEQFYRLLRNENKVMRDRCWEEKKKSLRLPDRKKVEEDERLYTDRDSWLRNMAIRIGIEKV